MDDAYLSYLEYRELRRRVERRLAKPRLLLVHVVIYVAVITGMMTWITSYFYGQTVIYQAYQYRFPFSLWAVVLMLHAVFVWVRSGAIEERRSQQIEHAIRERLNEDRDWQISSRSLFRLHALLDNDVRVRSGFTVTLAFTALLNAVMWVVWASLSSQSNTEAWRLTPWFALALLIPYGLNLWRQRRSIRKIRRTLERMSDDLPATVKHKKRHHLEADEYANETVYSLGDDGELVDDSGREPYGR